MMINNSCYLHLWETIIPNHNALGKTIPNHNTFWEIIIPTQHYLGKIILNYIR